MKQRLRYDQLSCHLEVEGLPDVSIGQSGDALGIITGWSLRWNGRPELEGRREHLIALMAVVLPYARNLISGVAKPCGGDALPVCIQPGSTTGTHLLQLHSSQPNTPSLDLTLDDAELSDLVRLLDQFRLDPRLQLSLDLPQPQPLASREVLGRVPRRQRLLAPLAGAIVLAAGAGLVLLLPEPPLRPSRPTQTTSPAPLPSSPPGDPKR
jgi:hypothetical protein